MVAKKNGRLQQKMAIQWKLTDTLRIRRGEQAWEFNIGDIISFVLVRATLFFRIEEFFVMGGNIILLGVYWDNEKNVQKIVPYIRVLSVTCPCNHALYVPIDEVTIVYNATKSETEPCTEENWREPVLLPFIKSP